MVNQLTQGLIEMIDFLERSLVNIHRKQDRDIEGLYSILRIIPAIFDRGIS